LNSVTDNLVTELRARELFEEDRLNLFKRVDRMFLVLLYFEWALATIIAVVLSPQTWEGPQSFIHFHVVEAFVFGGILISLPTLAVFYYSGQALTRHILAIAQMLMCGLVIQFTNGRIESHFSIFGALAFLAFYRDWKVVITASLIVAVDHFFRGIFWPQSVFGEITVTPWRWVEHTAWVVFEDLFLLPACLQSTQEMKSIAHRQAQIEAQNLIIQRDNEAKMFALVNGAVDGIVSIDEHGIIESVNKALAQMFGYSERELVGKDISILLDQTVTFEQMVESSRKTTKVPLEVLMKPRAGTAIPAEISVSEVHLNDRRFYTAIIRDISERKEVELRVSEFYSVVSHELRTPLTSIRGALGLIEGGIVGEVSPDVLELITIARSSSDRLIRLINDILDLRKIEAGKIELRTATVNLSDIVQKTVSGINGYSAEKNVSVTTSVDFDADMFVDADRIIQVLTNLLSNAIKFSDPGKTVELKAIQRDPEHIRFSVIDHGIGLDEQDQARLFQKFQQLDSSDSRKSEGTGLGLAISKALVESHGGTIGINSKKGLGSEFWFELPLQSAKIIPQRADAQFGLDQKLASARSEDEPGVKSAVDEEGRSSRENDKANMSPLKRTSKSDVAESPKAKVDGKIKKVKNGKTADQPVPPKTRISDGNNSFKDTGIQLPSSPTDASQEGAQNGSGPPGNKDEHTESANAEKSKRKRQKRSSTKNQSSRAINKPVVLIIEDDDATRKIVGAQLKSIDVECIEAKNGAIGIELAQSCVPDLIVLDLDLPQFDGFELVSMMRAEKICETPLLVYTGLDLTQQERGMLSLGVTKHLIKSTCSMTEFLDSVTELLLIDDPTRQLGANTQGH
jgi:PAS domain S-box-containing protein